MRGSPNERQVAVERGAILVARTGRNVEEDQLLQEHRHVPGQDRKPEFRPRREKRILVRSESLEHVGNVGRARQVLDFVIDSLDPRWRICIFNMGLPFHRPECTTVVRFDAIFWPLAV